MVQGEKKEIEIESARKSGGEREREREREREGYRGDSVATPGVRRSRLKWLDAARAQQLPVVVLSFSFSLTPSLPLSLFPS
jgi:hypothetical protein